MKDSAVELQRFKKEMKTVEVSHLGVATPQLLGGLEAQKQKKKLNERIMQGT
ncbi:hypothetical protein Tco_1571526, partial [Tanacetum coccineum]